MINSFRGFCLSSDVRKKMCLELHLFPLPPSEIRAEENVLIRIRDKNVFSFTRPLFTRELGEINFPKNVLT